MSGQRPPRLLPVAGGAARRPALITGGAGFIGANLAHRLASRGCPVIVYDNLSRRGVEKNLAWLKGAHGDAVAVEIADIRDAATLGPVVRRAGQVFHLAAQVAVTSSIRDPREDFAINAGGTLNLLEAVRGCATPPSLVFTSTNKVYGAIDDLSLVQGARRYEVSRESEPRRGIDERRPLDFHSPYGCSKGTADQYVLDYARSYGLPAVVFRMSCIYGPNQFGTEDQGWVAHFLLRALAGEPITVYGNGCQVRDILYVDDLLDAFQLAQDGMDRLGGQAFNIGGGADNTTSLIELIDRIAALHRHPVQIFYAPWRVGDQRYYVSDHDRFTRATGWSPKVSAADGVARLYHWLKEQRATEARPGAMPALATAAGRGTAASRVSIPT